jgi:hypothetical protein
VSDKFFPKLKNGKAIRPDVGEYVYVPTTREKDRHFIGGRGKVVASTVSSLQIEEHPGVKYSWPELRRVQYNLWRTFGETPASLPTAQEDADLREELLMKAIDAEALRVKQEEAIAQYHAAKAKARSPRPPTYVVKVKERNGPATALVGVAWDNDDGSFHIILNPCVVLAWNDDMHITLFPK